MLLCPLPDLVLSAHIASVWSLFPGNHVEPDALAIQSANIGLLQMYQDQHL